MKLGALAGVARRRIWHIIETNVSEFTYRSQQVDYLGFLEAQLRDLQGIDRLAYELIQNADDVKGTNSAALPTRLSFDVTDEALIVENDGVFRPLDFQRLQSIASGGKREERNTTGAFGLGFVAVYQVTDTPQIFSNGLHWIIDPAAPPERRIEERQAQTTGTRFVLPWAFDETSDVRRALRIAAIDRQSLDAIARELAAAITPGAIFLKQLTHLEVRRNSVPISQLRRKVAGERLVLAAAEGQSSSYRLFKGDFNDVAANLRQQYARQIEDKRHAGVTLALPTPSLPANGRLFAVLPTDTIFPLPLYISADFFPTTDRRRIHFEEGYQARWNEQAIVCAARVLTQHLDEVRQSLQPVHFWQLMQGAWQTEQAATRHELPDSFATFWQMLAPELARSPSIYTLSGDWHSPSHTRIVMPEALHSTLQTLGVSVVHSSLRPFYSLLRRPEVGVRDLSLPDIRAALQAQALAPGMPLAQAPPALRSLDIWRQIWHVVDDLLSPLPRFEQLDAALRHLGDIPLVLDDTMTLTTLRRVYRGDDEARALFPDLAWLHPLLDEQSFPARLLHQFGVRQAVEHLAGLGPDQLQQRWQMGQLDLPRLFRWFEAQQIEIFADDPSLQREIRNLPLVPIFGELRPLAHLYIPGDFEDPLKLAAVVDVEALGGRRQFLQDLGLQELNFETYVQFHIPRVLAQNPDLPSDARHRLLQLLARHLGHIRDDQELRRRLSRLPLVACMDGSFRPARDVYASREVAALLGSRSPIAEPPASQAIEALYRWLGVRREPTAAHLLQVVLEISAQQRAERQPLSGELLTTLLQCWHALEQRFQHEEMSDEQLAQLGDGRTLPNHALVMSQPRRLLFADQPEEVSRFEATPGDLGKYLLHSDFPFSSLVEAAGVRPFSAARQLDVGGDGPPAAASAVEQLILERRPLIARLLQAGERDDPHQDSLHILRNLRVLQVPGLQLSSQLQLGAETFRTESDAQSAALIAGDNTLYINAGEQPPPWAAIARELAIHIDAGRGAAGLALGIREILSAPTYDAAAAILDELGYP